VVGVVAVCGPEVEANHSVDWFGLKTGVAEGWSMAVAPACAVISTLEMTDSATEVVLVVSILADVSFCDRSQALRMTFDEALCSI